MENQIQIVNVNYIEESGLIAVNFFNTEGLVSGNTNLAEVKFKIKGDSFSKDNIGINNFKLYDSNSELLSSNDNVAADFKLNAEGISKNIKVIEKADDECDLERKRSKDSVKNNDTEKTSDEENKSEFQSNSELSNNHSLQNHQLDSNESNGNISNNSLAQVDSESGLANDSQEEGVDLNMTEDSDIGDNNSDSLNTENITNHLEQENEKKKNQWGMMSLLIIIVLIIGAGIVLVRSIGKNWK